MSESAFSDPKMAPEPTALTVPDPSVERLRLIIGAVVIGSGLLFVGLILWASLAHFKTSSDVVAVVGSVTGVVGTVVSAFFGIQASQAQGTQAHLIAQNAQRSAARAQADAGEANRNAAANAERGARGEALAQVVRQARSAVLGSAGAAEDTSFAATPGTHDSAVNSIQEVADFADKMFPENPS
jgi:hypothetical protein